MSQEQEATVIEGFEAEHLLLIEDAKGQQRIPLHDAVYSIGRVAVSNNIVVHSNSVSRQHAMLYKLPIAVPPFYLFRIVDGNAEGVRSTNGITINGKRSDSYLLVHGDEIVFSSDSRAIYQVEPAPVDLAAAHLEFANGIRELAVKYYSQNRFHDAEAIYQQALALKQKYLGDDHPDIALLLEDIAATYYAQSLHNDAESLFLQALAIKKNHFGDCHADVAITLGYLAELYYALRNYPEAKKLYTQSFRIFKQQLGLNHPNTITVRNNLQRINAKLSPTWIVPAIALAFAVALGGTFFAVYMLNQNQDNLSCERIAADGTVQTLRGKECRKGSRIFKEDKQLSLEFISIPPKSSAEPDGLLVALHGWGANAADLADLAPMLELPNYQMIFPEAPFPHPNAPDGRAWYALEKEGAEGLTTSRQKLTEFLQNLPALTGIPLAKTILLGFSQGGAMTLDVGLNLPLAKLIVLSGYLHAIANPPRSPMPPTLIVHGRMDYVVPLEMAKVARDTLVKLGVEVEYAEYDMGHEIRPAVIDRIHQFIF